MVIRIHITGLLILLILQLAGCSPDKKMEDAEVAGQQIPLDYAKGFEIYDQGNGIYRVVLPRPFNAATGPMTYLLVPRGMEVPEEHGGTIIRTPVEHIICTSTTHIPLLDYLGETTALVGFPTPDYISSPHMRKHIDSGKVADLGVDNAMNIEMVMELSPDVVMAYAISGLDPALKKLQALDIPVLLNAEYMEPHPLGRAEWIKLAGLLFDKQDRSDSVFQAIASNYLRLKQKADSLQNRPTAFSGIMYGDTWFMPGGNNYAARLMKDAAIEYLWAENDDHSYLELSFESVLEKAESADLWIGVASFTSLHALEEEDRRYGLFNAFRNGEVYTYDARKGEKGGSEYLELGYLRPDIILSDLMQIAHPETGDSEDLYFHAKLKP